MTSFKINDVSQRVQYTATASQTAFTVPFPFFADADITVYQNSTLLVLTTDYTLTGSGTASGGTLTLVTGATVSDIITIYGTLTIDRTSIYSPVISNLTGDGLNNDFNREIVMLKQQETTQDYLQLQYQPYAQVSQDVSVTIDRWLPLLTAGGVWRKNAGNTAIEVAVLPAYPVGSDVAFTSDNRIIKTDTSTSANNVQQTTIEVTDANIIQTTTGDLGFSAAGNIELEGVAWPKTGATVGYGLVVTGANQTAWSNVAFAPGTSTEHAIARFSNTTGDIEDSGVLLSDVDAITGITALTVDNVNINGNTISSTDTNGDINLSPNGTGTVVINTDLDIDNININGNTIISTDTNGNINLTPNGTGINVFANAQVTGLTASRAMATDASKNLVSSTVTDTELGYLSGVTSAIQTQFTSKISQSGAEVYAADSGIADAYIVTLSPVPSSLTVGQIINVLIGNTNTGASVMNVNGLSPAAPIKIKNDQALTAGDIEAGQIVKFAWDGTSWQMQSMSALDAASTVFDGYFNTLVLEATTIDAQSDGTTWTCTIEKTGGGDLTLAFSTGLYTFDSTPIASVNLTAGTDSVPVLNYVYIPIGTKVLTASTSGFPTSSEFVAVATVLCQSAATGATDEAYKVHAWQQSTTNSNTDNGQSTVITTWIRNQPATWENGTALTPTVGIATFSIAVSAGTIFQLNMNDFPALDTGAGAHVNVPNDFTTKYLKVTNLTSILTDANNVSMSNKRFNLVVWGCVSQDSDQCKLFINLPTASYNNDQGAIDDTDRTSVFNIPRTFRGTGFLIARLSVRHISSSGTWSILQNEDLRGLLAATATGSGVGGLTSVSDDPSPILGGNLGGGGFDITNVANLTVTTNITGSALTASRAVVTDGSKVLASSATTSTELGYVNGVTSAIQTQLNTKVSQSGAQVFAADAQANDTYVITLSPVPSGYVTGMVVSFSANTLNTGAATINVNALGAKAIEKQGVALQTGDILAGQLVTLIYNGTAFQMQSQLALSASSTSTNTFTNKTFNANGTGNSLSNVDVADLANGTDGELITWDATGAPSTVAVGTATHVLTSNGVGAAPTFQAAAAAGGSYEFIASATASGSASISFTGLTSAYIAYKIMITGVTPASIGILRMRTSTNNGSSYDSGASDYAWAYMKSTMSTSPALNPGADDADAQIEIVPGQGTDTSTGIADVEITLFNPSATVATSISGHGRYADSGLSQFEYTLAGIRLSAADVDAIQFLYSSGNIAAGEFRLYGVKGS